MGKADTALAETLIRQPGLMAGAWAPSYVHSRLHLLRRHVATNTAFIAHKRTSCFDSSVLRCNIQVVTVVKHKYTWRCALLRWHQSHLSDAGFVTSLCVLVKDLQKAPERSSGWEK